MEKLQEVIRILRHAGGKVISSCGIHVHMDASKHTPQSLKNVLSIVFVLINAEAGVKAALNGGFLVAGIGPAKDCPNINYPLLSLSELLAIEDHPA